MGATNGSDKWERQMGATNNGISHFKSWELGGIYCWDLLLWGSRVAEHLLHSSSMTNLHMHTARALVKKNESKKEAKKASSTAADTQKIHRALPFDYISPTLSRCDE
jgi:hypothetical protein